MASRRTDLAGLAAKVAQAAGARWIALPSDGSAAGRVSRLVKPGDLPKTEYLVHHATLAANRHNAHGWVFRSRAGRTDIVPDASRRTRVVETEDHHLSASPDAAAENLSLAAGSPGLTAAIRPDGAAVHVGLFAGGSVDPLFAAIALCQCTRSDDDGRAAGTQELATPSTAVGVEGTQLVLLTEPAQVAPVTDPIMAGARAQVACPAFVAGLRKWLRFTTPRARYRQRALCGLFRQSGAVRLVGRADAPPVFHRRGTGGTGGAADRRIRRPCNHDVAQKRPGAPGFGGALRPALCAAGDGTGPEARLRQSAGESDWSACEARRAASSWVWRPT